MWDLPGLGLEHVSPALAGRFLTTAPPGKPPHSLFEMVLYLEHLQVRAPGTLNGLLAAPNVGLTVVLCRPGPVRKYTYAHPKRMHALLDRWRAVLLSCQKSNCMRFFIHGASREAGSISRMVKQSFLLKVWRKRKSSLSGRGTR